MREITLSRGYKLLVSDEDYDSVMVYRWHTVPAGNTRYALRRETLPNGKRRVVRVHNFIMGVDSGVDHINRNGLDNTRKNLRLADKSLNSHNTTSWSKSGYKGVTKATNGNQWQARIMKNGKNYYLGKYDTPEEAALVYRVAATRLYGEGSLGD